MVFIAFDAHTTAENQFSEFRIRPPPFSFRHVNHQFVSGTKFEFEKYFSQSIVFPAAPSHKHDSSIFQRFLLISGVPAALDASYDYQNDADNYYNDDEEYYNYDNGNGSNEEIFDATGKKEVVNKRDPMFMSQPKKLLVNEGDIVKLPCVVDKFEAFVIIWKKGEKVISVGDNIMDSADTRCENYSKNCLNLCCCLK